MSGARRPQRLGRGLSALMGDTRADSQGRPPETPWASLPIEALVPGPFQPRGEMDDVQLDELADSIRTHGILQPILVRRASEAGRYEIIGGERRWRAAQRAQCHEVPVIVRTFSDREAMAAALVENLQRQDLNALEEAEGFRRLMEEFGLTQEGLGQSLGKSRSHIANTLRLLGLPEPVRMLLAKGDLSAGHARALISAENPIELARQVVDRGLSVRQTEALVGARPTPDRPAKPDGDTALQALERELSAHLGLRVTIKSDGVAGQLVVAFRDLDQLDGLVRLLKG